MTSLYNTCSRKKEIIGSPSHSLRANKINLFVCGPTVYDFSHIGHARTYIAFDVIARYLKAKKFDVFYLQNITDIDDKIIKRAAETQISPKSLAKRFEQEYIKDMEELKVLSVSKYARATDYIPEIVSQVHRLLEKEHAYVIPDDGIYYDISSFKEYGKLSGRTTQQAEDSVSRIDDSVRKRHRGDFALWKFSKRGEPKWKSPWGWGRPGWHIEDTAIAEKHFGAQYDIHGGARDLIFPHHEAEIAQMEGISGKKPLVRYWMHTGFLTIQGEKMSKSLGNFITIRDFLLKHSSRLLRFFVLKTHYRSPIDYSEENLAQAEQELERIDEFVEKIKTLKSAPATSKNTKLIQETKKAFFNAMDDDVNTPKAVAALFELVRKGNVLLSKLALNKDDARDILALLKEIDEIFSFIFWQEKTAKIPQELTALLKKREQYRTDKEWEKADEVRELISEKGWQVEDTDKGPKLKKI
ncbi:MAG: cysteine--tRNA ligase [bacterium]|nr:cysteine--tRNA ligase [bacterium]